MTEKVTALVEGGWYIDTETKSAWRILRVHEHTVEVVDTSGNRIVHSRLIWESDVASGATIVSRKQPVK